jgi:hypothetical protein
MLSILSTLPLISSMFYPSSLSDLPQNSAYCTPSLVLFRFCLYFFSSALPSTLRTSTSLHSHSIASFLAVLVQKIITIHPSNLFNILSTSKAQHVQLLNYPRPGRVCFVTSRMGTGKSLTFFTVYPNCTAPACTLPLKCSSPLSPYYSQFPSSNSCKE